MRRWRDLVIVALLAAMSFAGSFECHSGSGDETHHHSGSTSN